MAFKRWQIIAGIALLLCATAASALSLGRVRGTALLGRGLDLSFQMSLEAQEAVPEPGCFTADVFYGDTRISPSLISIGAERLPTGEARVRLRSSSMVDEPVVTLYVRVSCGAAISRRYVLLAETLNDADSGTALPVIIAPALSAPVPTPAPSNAPARGAQGVAQSANSSAAAPANASTGVQRAERAEQRRAKREARRPSREGAQVQAERVETVNPEAKVSASIMRRGATKAKTGAPRLQVDLLDLTSTELNLRGSSELGSMPSSDENIRRQAQALWRTLNASPEDALRDTQRLETLETQMRSALEQSKRQSQDISALSTELQAAQRARYFNPFTLFLGLLVLAAAALSLFLWRRGARSSQPWWDKSAAPEASDEQHLWEHLADVAEPSSALGSQEKRGDAKAKGSAAARAKSALPTASQSGSEDIITSPGVLAEKGSQGPLRFVEKATDPIDFKPSPDKFSRSSAKIKSIGTALGAGRGGSMGRVDSTPPPSLMSPKEVDRFGTVKSASGKGGSRSSRSFAHSDFAASGLSGSRLIDTEELFDIQEQADFFMSLGQPEQAIEVLKNHISDKVETSALAYMDLFNVYHQTGREQDYEQLRSEFNRVFNAHVPVFAEFGEQSDGLEDYPAVLQSIQAVWQQHQAQQVIEELIFRQPEQDQAPMDMTAYRELMALYTLAKELAQPSSGYSFLPSSSPIAVKSVVTEPSDAQLPDIDLGNGLMLSQPQEDMLSFDDPTMVIAAIPDEQAKELDFDLSALDDLSESKIPGSKANL